MRLREIARGVRKGSRNRSANEADWKAFRDRWMARTNGILTQINDQWLKAAPKEAKRDAGQKVNELKQSYRDRRTLEKKEIKAAVTDSAKIRDSVDPASTRFQYSRHHPPRHSPPSRRGAPGYQDDERNRRRIPQPWLLG